MATPTLLCPSTSTTSPGLRQELSLNRPVAAEVLCTTISWFRYALRRCPSPTASCDEQLRASCGSAHAHLQRSSSIHSTSDKTNGLFYLLL